MFIAIECAASSPTAVSHDMSYSIHIRSPSAGTIPSALPPAAMDCWGMMYDIGWKAKLKMKPG
jgi:hypothetical protein